MAITGVSDLKKMGEVETFLVKKLENALKNDEHSVFSDCLSKEFNRFSKNKETNTITPKEKLYFLNNVMADRQMVLNKKKNCCAPLAIRKAKNVQGSLKKIKEELQADPKVPNESCRWISHSVGKTEIHGIDNELMAMERLLVGKERKVGFEAIAIVGVTGVGKTTFCQAAFDNQEVRKYFEPRIWVYLPTQSMDMEDEDYKKQVVKNILMCLGCEEGLIDQIGGKESDGLSRLLLALGLKLKGKKYLIILDCDWNSDELLAHFCSSLTKDDDNNNKLDQLANGFPKGSGGKVIIMRRSKRLAADIVGEKNLHRLPLADDESCWKVFEDTVGIDLAKDMEDLKVKILEKCAGLPLVAKMLGQIELQKKKILPNSHLKSHGLEIGTTSLLLN